MNIFSQDWTNILIKGKHNSGKSEMAFWIMKQVLNLSKQKWMNRLLDDQERVLLFTEKINQVELIKMDLNNRCHIVENISTKDPLEYLKIYHERFGIELLVIDYINLLETLSKPYTMEALLNYLHRHQIRWIFVENTFKSLKEDLKVEKQADNIFTISRTSVGLEVNQLKEKGVNLVTPKSRFINLD